MRAFSTAMVAAASAVAVLAPGAVADQPATTITQVDRTFTVAAGPGTCPFPFDGHTVGTTRETVFSNGRDVTHTVDFHVTYTNPADGRSLSLVLAGPFIIEPNGDGTVTVTINGNDGHLEAPGRGSIFADVGRLVYIADPSDVFTPLTIVSSAGQQDASQFPATCEGLE